MSQIRLKPLSQQVIVITGASSGIGLATARMASEAGARVFLISRNGEALAKIVAELRGRRRQRRPCGCRRGRPGRHGSRRGAGHGDLRRGSIPG